MVHAARALELGVMVGCMVESGLAIAPACAVASLCDHVDLDGNLLLADDPWQGVELVDGVQLPSERPGLGMVPRTPNGRRRGVGVGTASTSDHERRPRRIPLPASSGRCEGGLRSTTRTGQDE